MKHETKQKRMLNYHHESKSYLQYKVGCVARARLRRARAEPSAFALAETKLAAVQYIGKSVQLLTGLAWRTNGPCFVANLERPKFPVVGYPL